MLSLIRPYVAWLAAGAAVAVGGYIALLKIDNAGLAAARTALEADLAAERGRLATCGARLENILEALESDATVPDDLGDFDVPPAWLLDGTATPDHAD